LVNNAGGQFPSTAEDISEKGWNAVINNNLNGTWYATQVMTNTFFIPQKDGIIINIIANIFRGFPGMAHTGAARAGVDNLTKTLAVEWSKYNIRVNAVAPGIIFSSGLENYPIEMLKGISDTLPMKRLGSTEEVAWLTLFLASPMAAYITGETVYIDGGQRLFGQQFQI
jgi:citronellol/citronellal dehydrogenase